MPVIEVDSLLLQRDLVRRSFGATLLPATAAPADINAGRLTVCGRGGRRGRLPARRARLPGRTAHVALPATLSGRDGIRSRIVTRRSGPTSTARADAGIIVTEHGVTDLRGLGLAERRRRMLDIAAPEFRSALEAGEETQILPGAPPRAGGLPNNVKSIEA